MKKPIDPAAVVKFVQLSVGFDTIANSKGFPFADIPDATWNKAIPSIMHVFKVDATSAAVIVKDAAKIIFDRAHTPWDRVDSK